MLTLYQLTIIYIVRVVVSGYLEKSKFQLRPRLS